MKILDFNHCNIVNCDCGWNVEFSGSSKQELNKLIKLIKDNFPNLEDKTNYSEKISIEKF